MENGALPHAQPQRFYRPELDAMRFFAFLCVFFHHTLSRISVGGPISPYPFRDVFTDSLKYAVSLFFLLSGYLITTLLKIEQESMGKVDLRAFYGRRIARIWPLYYSFLVIVLLVGIAVPRELPVSGALLAFLFFSGNWFNYAAGGAVGGLVILWSVNVEEQFYLFWPLLIRFGRSRQGRLIPAVILVCSYVILIVYGVLRHNSDVALRFNTPIEMQFFAAGGILAAWLPRAGLRIPFPLRLMLVLSGLSSWIVGDRCLSIFGKAEIRTIPMWWVGSCCTLRLCSDWLCCAVPWLLWPASALAARAASMAGEDFLWPVPVPFARSCADATLAIGKIWGDQVGAGAPDDDYDLGSFLSLA
jgi:peptidoglycan/LPS O-acetylase OafA/YrhL